VIAFILEAIEAPAPGWPGRRGYIARQLLRALVEGLVFVLALVGLLGCVVLVWAAQS
jgi:hypothetical protein